MSVAEMRMLRWISGVTREGSGRIEYVWRNIVVAIVDKMRENRHREFDCAMKRKNSEYVRTVMEINIEGKKERNRRICKIEEELVECHMKTA